MPPTLRSRTSTSTRLAVSSPSSAAPGPSGSDHHNHALDYINNATKWAVSATTALVLLRNRNDPSTRFAVVGSVFAAFLTKILKKLINESRPREARKRDPGMPSSHAQSLSFLSVSAARAILVSKSKGGTLASFLPPLALPLPSPAPLAVAALVLGAAALLATLRVVLGYHTWPQVVAGGALGCFLALSWAELGARVVVPLCSSNSSSGSGGVFASSALACATGAAVAVFALVTVRSWWRESRSRGVEREEETAEASSK